MSQQVTELFRSIAAKLFRDALVGTGGDHGAAEELVQEAFQALWNARDRTCGLPVDEQRAWPFGTLRNKVIDRFRRTRRELVVDPEEFKLLHHVRSVPAATRKILVAEMLDRCWRVIERMPPTQQHVFWLRAHEWKTAEIAGAPGDHRLDRPRPLPQRHATAERRGGRRQVSAPGRRLAGLDASFEDFCRDNLLAVERFLRSQCGDRELVQEAVQETLITAWDKWEEISGYEKPLAWVYKTAHDKLVKPLARQRREAATPLDEVPSDRLAAPPADSREVQEWLLSCLRRMPERQAAVFALAHEGWTDPEIARILGLANNTVRSYKSAARRRLKKLAEEAGFTVPARGR